MREERPLVSVIIPVYNCERYLAEAIESVLAQTYRPIEVIVVDDGSKDGTAVVAGRYISAGRYTSAGRYRSADRYGPAVRYAYQSNCGGPAARNRGVEMAEGEFLSFLDADDVWVEDKLERQMVCFDDDSTLDMVCGHVQNFISPDVQGELEGKLHCPEQAMPGPGVFTMLIPKDAFLRVGPFDDTRNTGDTLEWNPRAVDRGLKSLLLTDVVQWRRLHRGNSSLTDRDGQHDTYLRIVRELLDRRRRPVVGTGEQQKRVPAETSAGGDE